MAKYASTLAAIDKMTDSAEISDAVNSAKKVFKECDFYAVNDLYFGERDRKDSSHTLTSDEVRQILEVMKSSTKPIDQIKRIGKNEIANLKQKQKDLKFQKQLQSDNAEAVAQINGKYKLASAYITAQSKNLNAHCNAYARYLAACRRAFVLAGKKAAASEEKSTEEAAMFDFVLGEASNDYVEAMLLG
jgi:DNA repair ATPase RecN